MTQAPAAGQAARAVQRRLRLAAPAKVNFGLRITGRRPDGYHELESLFLPISLADELELALEAAPGGPGGEPVLAVEGPAASGVPVDASNLVARAAAGFLREAGIAGRRAVIRLHKAVPAAAGLGGGSSDAAAVLRGLDRLLPGVLAPEALAALALRLGADVPFFLDPRPALVRGMGEQIEPLPGLPPAVLVLAHPGTGLSTAAVYRAYDQGGVALTPPGVGSTMRALSRLRGRDGRVRWSGSGAEAGRGAGRETGFASAPDAPLARDALVSLLDNDLEPAAQRLCPALRGLREQLHASGARAVGMSGSGPSVFGVFEDEAGARAALSRISLAPPAWARIVTTVASV